MKAQPRGGMRLISSISPNSPNTLDRSSFWTIFERWPTQSVVVQTGNIILRISQEFANFTFRRGTCPKTDFPKKNLPQTCSFLIGGRPLFFLSLSRSLSRSSLSLSARSLSRSLDRDRLDRRDLDLDLDRRFLLGDESRSLSLSRFLRPWELSGEDLLLRTGESALETRSTTSYSVCPPAPDVESPPSLSKVLEDRMPPLCRRVSIVLHAASRVSRKSGRVKGVLAPPDKRNIVLRRL
ncbi:unnamed protein product, partial [Nesidiocoris tenuis]